MKRILFWLLFPFIAILVLGGSVLYEMCDRIMRGLAVMVHFAHVFEYWAFDTPKNFYRGDPRNERIRDVWDQGDMT